MHLGETLFPWKSKDKKCCLYKTPYVAAPIWILGDILQNSTPNTWLSTDAPTRARILFFWVCEWQVSEETRLIILRLLGINFYKEICKQKWYQKGLRITLLEESHKEYLQASLWQYPTWISLWWLQYWVIKMEFMVLNSQTGFRRSLARAESSLLFKTLFSLLLN